MKHVKNFDEFLTYKNPDSDPNREADKGTGTDAKADSPEKDTADTADATVVDKKPESADQKSPEGDVADDPKAKPEEEKPSDTPASDKAEDANKKVEDETDVKEGNAFTGAIAKAKEEGKTEFEFEGKTYKVREKLKESQIADFEGFLAENFTLYPSYNNMIGSEVLRNVPITHQVNMAVYGRENVVEATPPVAVVAVEVKEGEETKVVEYTCEGCGCKCEAQEVEQNPEKKCSECGGTTWSAGK